MTVCCQTHSCTPILSQLKDGFELPVLLSGHGGKRIFILSTVLTVYFIFVDRVRLL